MCCHHVRAVDDDHEQHGGWNTLDRQLQLPFECKSKVFFRVHYSKGSSKTIYAGNTYIAGEPERFTKKCNLITLKGVMKDDAGKYRCQVDKDPNNILLHHLDVESQARGKCTLENVSRSDSGTYTCTASNGIGEAARASIELIVEYKPQIKTEKDIVQTHIGDSATLLCIVNGRPDPNVTMHKGDVPHGTNRLILSSKELTHYTFTVENVTKEDLGEYICEASNEYGTANSTLDLRVLSKGEELDPSGNKFIMIGSITSILLVVGLLIIAVICRKKIKNNKQHVASPKDLSQQKSGIDKGNCRHDSINSLYGTMDTSDTQVQQVPPQRSCHNSENSFYGEIVPAGHISRHDSVNSLYGEIVPAGPLSTFSSQ